MIKEEEKRSESPRKHLTPGWACREGSDPHVPFDLRSTPILQAARRRASGEDMKRLIAEEEERKRAKREEEEEARRAQDKATQEAEEQRRREFQERRRALEKRRAEIDEKNRRLEVRDHWPRLVARAGLNGNAPCTTWRFCVFPIFPCFPHFSYPCLIPSSFLLLASRLPCLSRSSHRCLRAPSSTPARGPERPRSIPPIVFVLRVPLFCSYLLSHPPLFRLHLCKFLLPSLLSFEHQLRSLTSAVRCRLDSPLFSDKQPALPFYCATIIYSFVKCPGV